MKKTIKSKEEQTYYSQISAKKNDNLLKSQVSDIHVNIIIVIKRSLQGLPTFKHQLRSLSVL